MAIPIAHNYSAPNCSNAAVCSADCDNGRSEENNNCSVLAYNKKSVLAYFKTDLLQQHSSGSSSSRGRGHYWDVVEPPG